jgi:hypothetical protein
MITHPARLRMTIDIKHNVGQFQQGFGKDKGRGADHRYASFDYCFNYFQGFRDSGSIADLSGSKNLQVSCLQLAFYLASWGMYRGSARLRQKSAKYLAKTIQLISKYDPQIWNIDVDNYCDETVETLLDFKHRLRESLGKEVDASDILVTKVMLGVFANTPAFDTRFCKGFGVSRFDEKSLWEIATFYAQNKTTIDNYRIYTLDFDSGLNTNRLYTKAKIIDMIGFIEGQPPTQEASNRKRQRAREKVARVMKLAKPD